MDDEYFTDFIAGVFNKNNRNIRISSAILGQAKVAGNNLDNDSFLVFGFGDISGHKNVGGFDFAGHNFLVVEGFGA